MNIEILSTCYKYAFNVLGKSVHFTNSSVNEKFNCHLGKETEGFKYNFKKFLQISNSMITVIYAFYFSRKDYILFVFLL